MKTTLVQILEGQTKGIMVVSILADSNIQFGNIRQLAFGSWRSNGTKLAILESKLRSGTSKTKQLN